MDWGTIAKVGAAMLGTVTSALGVNSTNKIKKKAYDKSLEFQKEQFQYQKYLNNNQFQIQSADAQKAGINPLAMSGGSFSSGNFTSPELSADNPFSGFGSMGVDIANILNQKEISSAKNKTDLDIAKINSQNQKDIAILKILSDEKIANNLNENQMNMLLAELSSKEGIASDKLAEDKRHNKAIEEIQDKLAESQKVLNSGTVNHYVTMDALNSVNSAIDKLLAQSNDKRLNSYLQLDKKKLEQSIKEGNVKNGTSIANSIIDVIKIVLPILGLL